MISGIEPLEARFAFLKLKHLYRIQLKPQNSLVKIIFNQMLSIGSSRPGFLTECKELSKKYGLEFSRLVPPSADTPLGEFAQELKSDLYRCAFQKDLDIVKESRQASIMTALFPPNSSYFSLHALRYSDQGSPWARSKSTHGIFAKPLRDFIPGQRLPQKMSLL